MSEFIESYNKLKDLTPGDVAVSKDREKIFACGYARTMEGESSMPVTLELNNLYSQYPEKIDMEQPVKILKGDDKFIVTR